MSDKYQSTFVLCTDNTWERFYSHQNWKYYKLEDILQLRGWNKPHVVLHEEDTTQFDELEISLIALAELGHIHLEFASIEDSLVDEGSEDVVINKFFPRGL